MRGCIYVELFNSQYCIANRQKCCYNLIMTETMRRIIDTLITEIAKGKQYALDDLSRLVSARMLSLAQSIVRDRALAEDVVQDSFVRIVNSARKYRPGTNGYGWICKITQNVALSALRREKRQLCVNIDDCLNISDGGSLADSSAAQLTVVSAMEQLTQQERQVIYYKYFADYTLRDIAALTGRSKSAVHRTELSAENKLKILLDGGTNDGNGEL